MLRWMYQVDVYLWVRRAVMVEGMNIREASRNFEQRPGHSVKQCQALRCGTPLNLNSSASLRRAPPQHSLDRRVR